MKKLLLAIALFAIGFSIPCYAQKTDEEAYQEYLQRSKDRMAKKQKLIDAQHGHHFGVTLSNATLVGLGNGGMKNGAMFFYGYRISEYWMLGGMAGADVLTPGEITYIDSSTDKNVTIDRPIISFPIMGEVRLYFGTSRFMPYLFTGIGASVSKYTGVLWNTGIGSDINFKDSHTIFLSLGIGTTPVPGVPDSMGLGYADQVLQKQNKFTINFKLGYYF